MSKLTTVAKDAGQLRAAIYIRVSTDEQVDGYSLAAQERVCRAYVEAHGGTVSAIYADEGASGTREDRPQLQQLRADVAAGKIEVVIVHKLDRLARNLKLTLEIIEELGQQKVPFISVTDNLDLSTPFGMAAFQVQGVFAELYSRNLSFETAKGLTEKARSGGWVGPVPLGYKKTDDGSLIPSADADAVRLIFEFYASGQYSDTSLADELNLRGWQSRDRHTGERKLFGRESVRAILKNRAYLGFVSSGGQEYKGNHEALVTETLWTAAHRIRGGRVKKAGRVSTQGGGGALSGTAYCARCGKPMWHHASGPGVLYYLCSGRDHRTCDAPLARADQVEEQILEVLRGVDIPAQWRDEVARRVKVLLGREEDQPKIDRDVVEQRLERLGIAFINGDLSQATYDRERQRLRQLLVDASDATADVDVEGAIALLGDMGTLIDVATPAERRAMLHNVFSHIWLEKHELKAITPKGVFLPLFGVNNFVRMGWLTGVYCL